MRSSLNWAPCQPISPHPWCDVGQQTTIVGRKLRRTLARGREGRPQRGNGWPKMEAALMERSVKKKKKKKMQCLTLNQSVCKTFEKKKKIL